jgi:hypothetical protein
MGGEIWLEAIDSTGASGAAFPEFFPQKALQHDTTNLALQTAFFFFLWEWGGEGFFFLLVFQQVLGREMGERDVSHRETDVGEILSQKH